MKYDLLKKGVDNDIISEMHSNIDFDMEERNAEVLVSKRYSILMNKESDKRKVYEKLLRYLISRGFEWETSKKVIRKILDVSIEDG